jgi:outer membrane immunogenic protein
MSLFVVVSFFPGGQKLGEGKMKFTRILLAGAASVALLGSANAAGTWQGWYAGINAGYAWSDVDSNRTITNTSGYFLPGELASIQTLSAFDFDDGDAATGGFQVGYNHDMGSWVLGVEADFNFLNATDNATTGNVNVLGYVYESTAKFEQDWLSTLRLKLGFEAGSTLIYLTGGGAAGDVAVTQGFGDAFGGFPYSEQQDSETLFGWTAGAGIEMPLSGNTTVKLEYLYVDLGDTDVQTADFLPGFGVAGSNTSVDVTEQIVRVGLNIKL